MLLNRTLSIRYRRANTVIVMGGRMHEFLDGRYEMLRKAIRNFKFADELESVVNENA